ncbi:hypothetical protein Emtol_4208 [Emticicia oligotrophica DSM 17448]|uniref:Uncharacterized protein n=1 Tax=Emticicia oligotrophica (strain DSM 17448 / CIP 109782 / MTCC 6937 / GPTSA100-15) TaxID=929562 RepID=A0ABM5N7G9_EMTOG|nr:hypothetical protein Emtol_4208 [Emticicia oligotrophica DSM 17448]
MFHVDFFREVDYLFEILILAFLLNKILNIVIVIRLCYNLPGT